MASKLSVQISGTWEFAGGSGIFGKICFGSLLAPRREAVADSAKLSELELCCS